MASKLLTHLPLASTHMRASIAFFLLIITIFVVPFLSLSKTSEVVQGASTAPPTIAYTFWDSLLGILTSSSFFFFLLNFLIVALVFSSGALDPLSLRRHGGDSDDLQDGDLHQGAFHSFSTAAQIIHERLALDELYESQASSLPYLNITENSARTYVLGAGTIAGDGGKAHTSKGKQVMENPLIDSFLHENPTFSDADGSDSTDEGSSRSGTTRATEEFFPAGGVVGDDSDMKKTSLVSSVVIKNEIAHPHGVCEELHAEETHNGANLHPDSDADACADADADVCGDTADVLSADDDVIDDEDSNDVIHEEGSDDVIQNHEDGGDHVDDGIAHIVIHECTNGTQVEAKGDAARRCRIARTPSEPVMTGKIEREMEVGAAERREEEEGMGRCMSLERMEWLGGVEKQKEKEMLSLSREELNQRASAFISAFRKKLVSTAIDDVSGQM